MILLARVKTNTNQEDNMRAINMYTGKAYHVLSIVKETKKYITVGFYKAERYIENRFNKKSGLCPLDKSLILAFS